MPVDLYKNDQIYNIVAEGEIAQLISHFSNGYIMDTITNNIQNRFAYNPSVSNPNIVNSYELVFKDMMSTYPSDSDNIMSIRYETYMNIISIICNAFNVQYIGNEPDNFIITYHLYDLFVSGYARNIINFFSRYIYQFKDTLYDNMSLDRYKKDKDTSTNYIKKVYNDQVIATIISRIKEVIYYISGFDIDMYTFLSYNYSKETCDFLYSNIAPMGNIFKDEFCRVIGDPALLTDIRLAIQKLIPQQQPQVMSTQEPSQGDKSDDYEEESDQ